MTREIYIAGKVESGETTVQDFASELESRGHIITFKWWEGKLQRPYLDNSTCSAKASEKMIEAINKCGVFILIPKGEILGAAIEFGIALRDRQENVEKEVLVVVEPNKTRQSVFFAHRGIIVVENIEQIRQREWY